MASGDALDPAQLQEAIVNWLHNTEL
jgi:hypothetical protein